MTILYNSMKQNKNMFGDLGGMMDKLKQAQQKGYRSRAAFKLLEINET